MASLDRKSKQATILQAGAFIHSLQKRLHPKPQALLYPVLAKNPLSNPPTTGEDERPAMMRQIRAVLKPLILVSFSKQGANFVTAAAIELHSAEAQEERSSCIEVIIRVARNGSCSGKAVEDMQHFMDLISDLVRTKHSMSDESVRQAEKTIFRRLISTSYEKIYAYAESRVQPFHEELHHVLEAASEKVCGDYSFQQRFITAIADVETICGLISKRGKGKLAMDKRERLVRNLVRKASNICRPECEEDLDYFERTATYLQARGSAVEDDLEGSDEDEGLDEDEGVTNSGDVSCLVIRVLRKFARYKLAVEECIDALDKLHHRRFSNVVAIRVEPVPDIWFSEVPQTLAENAFYRMNDFTKFVLNRPHYDSGRLKTFETTYQSTLRNLAVGKLRRYVHAELKLVLYYAVMGYLPVHSMVSVSKYLCLCCGEFLKFLQDPTPSDVVCEKLNFVVKGCYRYGYPSWLDPSPYLEKIFNYLDAAGPDGTTFGPDGRFGRRISVPEDSIRERKRREGLIAHFNFACNELNKILVIRCQELGDRYLKSERSNSESEESNLEGRGRKDEWDDEISSDDELVQELVEEDMAAGMVNAAGASGVEGREFGGGGDNVGNR